MLVMHGLLCFIIMVLYLIKLAMRGNFKLETPAIFCAETTEHAVRDSTG